MLISDYDIDLEKVVKTIKNNNYKTIALQIPEGFKNYASKFVDFLEEKTNSTVIIIADPCYGACDIANIELLNLGVDFVIQIGHSELPNIGKYHIPMAFINALSKKEISKVVEKSLTYLEGKIIGIITTSQHVHRLNEVEDILKKNNFKPLISKGDKRISSKGQILGCNFSSATSLSKEVDCFLFIGSGTFHPLGILIDSKKPVIAADPYTNTVKKRELEELKDAILRQRYGAIANSKNSKKFGILIGIKRGQQRMKLVPELKKIIKDNNKESLVISLDFFSPESLEGFRDIDCFVSTACPRVAIDDYLRYKIPIITPIELEIVLGIRKWEDFKFDQIF